MNENNKPLNDVFILAEGASERGEERPFERSLNRFGKAKKTALAQAHYIKFEQNRLDLSIKVATCGSYLVFRHYLNTNDTRLIGMKSCHEHLLCPLCAIRRGGKTTSKYLEKLQIVLGENPKLKPYFVTLTVKNGDDLAERYKHLTDSVKLMQKYRHDKKRSLEIQKAHGGVGSIEIKRGKNSGKWHPHYHAIWLCEEPPNQAKLSKEWQKITKDSFIVDVRPLRGQFDDENGEFFKSLCEVFKYAVKFSEQPLADTYECFITLKNRRLLNSFGNLYGVKVPEKLTDDPLENEPYIELFYRYTFGQYHLESHEIKEPANTEPQAVPNSPAINFLITQREAENNLLKKALSIDNEDPF